MQAVILAGGKGTRLASRLNGQPKPLVDVDGVPLLERQLVQLVDKGVDEALVLVNHAADRIASFLGRREFGCRTLLIDDGVPRGTSGAVLACLDRLAERFLVVYGDTLFDIDVQAFVAAHTASGAEATLLLHPNDHPADSDLVELGEGGRILAFHGYPHPAKVWLPNLVNAAFYCIERRLIERWRDFPSPSDFAKDLFPAVVRAGGVLHGYRSLEYIKDLGTPKRLGQAEQHLRRGVVKRSRLSEPQRVVFLDRDGTINVLRDDVRRAEDLELIPGAGEAVRRLNEGERRVVVITNQPVLARGECSFEEMRRIHAKLDTELGRSGGYIDALYYCPHHPQAGFPGEVAELKIICDCRKPMTGLLERAVADLNIDRARAFFVGDSTGDILAAQRAGVMSVLVETGEGGRDGRNAVWPDFTVRDLAAAVDLILERHPAILAQLGDLPDNIGPGDLVLVGELAFGEVDPGGNIGGRSARGRPGGCCRGARPLDPAAGRERGAPPGALRPGERRISARALVRRRSRRRRPTPLRSLHPGACAGGTGRLEPRRGPRSRGSARPRTRAIDGPACAQDLCGVRRAGAPQTSRARISSPVAPSTT